jgi:hypothetical protein
MQNAFTGAVRHLSRSSGCAQSGQLGCLRASRQDEHSVWPLVQGTQRGRRPLSSLASYRCVHTGQSSMPSRSMTYLHETETKKKI